MAMLGGQWGKIDGSTQLLLMETLEGMTIQSQTEFCSLYEPIIVRKRGQCSFSKLLQLERFTFFAAASCGVLTSPVISLSLLTASSRGDKLN